MAVGAIKLTHRQRGLLSMIFTSLNVLQILLGCAMIACSLYIIISVSPIFHTDSAEINFVFVMMALLGSHVVFVWLIGIKVGLKCYKQADKKSTRGILLLWICAAFNTTLNLLIVSDFGRKINQHIVKSIRSSIATGMKNYLSDLNWKKVIDMLQYHNQCCGIESFEDWHEIVWLTKYHVDTKTESVKQFRTSDEVLTLPVTPWSCCKVDFPMQCLHDPLQQIHYAHIWVDEPSVVIDSINTKGCLSGLKKPVTAIISIFIFLSTLIFIVHLMTFCIARILYTSARNATLLGYPKGIAPGWIFGRGDCGYKGGKTLGEMMECLESRSRHLYEQSQEELPLTGSENPFGQGIVQTEEPEESDVETPRKFDLFKAFRRKPKLADTTNPQTDAEDHPQNTTVEELNDKGYTLIPQEEKPTLVGELKRLQQ